MQNQRIKLPLTGLKVLDFTHAAAGPFATMFLADMGAEVVKVEKIGSGDGARSMGVPMPSDMGAESDYSIGLNRNKRGIALDLSQAEGQEIARALAAQADVVVQNFRPEVMPRLGLGFDQLAALRPGLIYVSISAFGPEGPWSSRPANDIIMQSVSGLMAITGEPDGGPLRIGAPISDYTTGLFALSGLLAALHARGSHPEGQHVQVSMLESSLNLMANYVPSVVGLGAKVPRVGRAHATIVPYQAFECADGEYVMVGAFTRGFWESFARALDREHWLTDPRFSSNGRRLKNREALVAQISEIIATAPRSYWLALLEAADVPVGPVLELDDALRSEQVLHDGSLIELTHGDQKYTVVRSPIRVEAWGDTPLAASPPLGGNSSAVLQEWLHLDEATIAKLDNHQIIAARDLSCQAQNETEDSF